MVDVEKEREKAAKKAAKLAGKEKNVNIDETKNEEGDDWASWVWDFLLIIINHLGIIFL